MMITNQKKLKSMSIFTFKSQELHYELFAQEDVDFLSREIMYQIFENHYDEVSQFQFFEDLNKKQYIALIKSVNEIVGFTTFQVSDMNSKKENYSIVFSGDTIIKKEHWGSQIMAKGWIKSVAHITKKEQNKTWYWFLISKGHRTYMYLPLFFEKYYPSLEPDREDNLFSLVDNCSKKMFGNYWNPKKGIIQFSKSMGQLKSDFWHMNKKKNNAHIDFFYKMNPDYNKGNELVCMAEISSNNLRSFIKRMFDEDYFS